MDGSTQTTLAYKAPDNLAGRFQRLGAKLVDTFITLVITYSAAFLSVAFGPNRTIGAITICLGVAYYLFADALPNGQSLGKKLFGICVIDERSYLNCNILQAFIRNLPMMFLSILDWLFIFSSSRKRLGDMFASTVVVKFK